jgi:hypothetical protein
MYVYVYILTGWKVGWDLRQGLQGAMIFLHHYNGLPLVNIDLKLMLIFEQYGMAGEHGGEV